MNIPTMRKVTKKLPALTPTARNKRKAPISLRSVKDEMKYKRAKQSGKLKPLLEEPVLRQWKYWRVIDNIFPYSTAFKTHHLLLPDREVDKDNLSVAERKELDLITRLLEEENRYDCVLLNFTRNQSIRHHFHLHLLVYKDHRTEMHL